MILRLESPLTLGLCAILLSIIIVPISLSIGGLASETTVTRKDGQTRQDALYHAFAAEQDQSTANSYEEQLQGWQTKASMPSPRSEIGAAAIDGKIYVVGGLDNKADATNKVFVYDVGKNTWSETLPMPLALHHVGTAAYQGKLYVVGGYLDGWRPSNSLLVYDPSSDSWSARKDMPTARGALTAQFVDGMLYAVGGFDPDVHNTNEEYDPKTNTWKKKKEMPTAREHLASAVLDGQLYVIGGRKGSIGNIDANEAYDPARNTWKELQPLPTSRSGIAAAAIGDRIFVFGGESSAITFDENESYSPKDERWRSHLPMPTARHGLSAVAVENKIYVIGGGVAPGFSFSGINEVYHNKEVVSLKEKEKHDKNEEASKENIPRWVRDIFVWYGDRLVSEKELLGAIEYLVNNKIIKLDSS